MRTSSLALATTILVCGTAHGTDSVYTPAQVIEGVKNGSVAYCDIARRYQYTFVVVSIARSPTDQQGRVTEVRMRCRHLGDFSLSETLTTPDPSRLEAEPGVVAVNDKYYFDLRQPKSGAGWAVQEFRDFRIPAQKDKPSYFTFRGRPDPVNRGGFPYRLASRDWLPGLVDQPWFKITRVSHGGGHPAHHVLVDYEFPDPDVPGLHQHGRVVLDPTNQWMVTWNGHNSTHRGGTKRTTRVGEFQPCQDGILLEIGARVTVTSDVPRFKDHTRDDVLTVTFTREQAREDEFFLSAFGLPEPPGMERSRFNSGWLWLMATAVGLIAITTLFVALKRRASRRQATMV